MQQVEVEGWICHGRGDDEREERESTEYSSLDWDMFGFSRDAGGYGGRFAWIWGIVCPRERRRFLGKVVRFIYRLLQKEVRMIEIYDL